MKKTNERVWRKLLLLGVTLAILMMASRCHDAKKAETTAEPTVTVLMYHHLLPRGEAGKYAGNSIVTYAEEFEKQLDFLCENEYHTVTPAQIEAFFYEHTPLPDKAVLITFDDGYLSNAAVAYPLLKQRKMCATVFLVTGHLGENGQTFSPALVQMTDEDTIKKTTDVFTYACHTEDLHKIHGGTAALCEATADERAADLQTSLAFLKTIHGASQTVFAYPYGAYNDKVKESLRQAGFRLAFRASEGVVTADSDPFALPRFPVDSGVSFSRFCQYFGVCAENG